MHARQRIFGDLSDRRSGPNSDDENGMSEVEKNVRRTHNNLATIIDDESEAIGDSLNSKLDSFHQSTGNKSNGDLSPHEDYKSVSRKVSGGIHVQPSFESECLRQNAAIAMEMDDMMVFFHDHHYCSVEFEQNQSESTDTADSIFHERSSSRADSSTDSAGALTNRQLSQPDPNGSHYVSPALIKHDATLETNQRVANQVFNRRAGSYSHRYFSHSNRLSNRHLTNKGHFSSLLSVDEEFEVEQPSWSPEPNLNKKNLSVKKSLDVKLSEKNELTQLMDTIMNGCYPNDGDNSDVFSPLDENSEVHLTPVEVDHITDDQTLQINITHSFERIAKDLRPNTSMGKESIRKNNGSSPKTSKTIQKEDVPKLAQVPESEPMEEELNASDTNFNAIMPPVRNHSLAQAKLGTNVLSHDDSAREKNSILDEDVVQSYRMTQNSDVIQSYRMRDRKMPAISKLLFNESSAGIDVSNKKNMPRKDGTGNKSSPQRPPKGQATEKTRHARQVEKSEDKIIQFEAKTNGQRGSKMPKEPANERDTIGMAVSNRNKVDSRRCLHGSNECLEEDLPQKPDGKENITLKMSERERAKRRSLAWQSSNGLNGDEEFSPKERLPRAKTTFSGKTSLLSMVQQSATFREHFRDSRSKAFHLRNPLYNPDSNFDHTIHEESHENSDDEIGTQNLEENKSIAEYHYDSFMRDFKDILHNEPAPRKEEATQTTKEHVEWPKHGGKSNNKSVKDEKMILSRELKAASFLVDKPSNVAMTRAAFENQLRHTTQLPFTGGNQMTLKVEQKKSQVKQVARNTHKKLSVSNSAPTNQSVSNPKRSHPHNLPSTEVTKSLLEEKLRGLKGSSKKECGNSVATSELGSLLTRESETSHFVPRFVFNRTRPSSDIDSLHLSQSSMQKTIDDTSPSLVQKETDALPKSFDNRDFPNRTSKRVRIVLPDLSAPMESHDEREESVLVGGTVASRIRLIETRRSLVCHELSRGGNSKRAATNDKKILSSNANAAAAIARIDDELDKVRLQHSTSAIAVSSDSHIPIELATKQKVSKMPLHDRNQDTNAILDPAGQVKKAALKNETMKVTDFWKMLEKSSEGSDRLDNKQEAVPSSSTKTSAINNNRVAEDGSQVSFSEEFEIAPRLQLDGKYGHISDLGVYNVVNGAFPKEWKKCDAFADSSQEDGSFGPIHDVYESSSHHAFEIAPVQRPRLILLPPTEYSCSGPKIPSSVCEIPKEVDSNAKTSGGRRTFMKNSWTHRIMKSNNTLSAPTKISSTKPITFSKRKGHGL